MPTPKEFAFGALAGTATSAFVAWRALFPYLGDDIRTLFDTAKITNLVMKKIQCGKLLVDTFEENVARDPKKTCIVHEDKCYSYEIVDAMANKVANIVLAWNLQPSDIVATMIYNEPAFVWTFLGLQKVGLADAFINYNLTFKPLLHSLKVSEAKVIIIGKGDELLHSILEIQKDLKNLVIYVQGKTQAELPEGLMSFDDAMLHTLPVPVCRSVRSHLNLKSPLFYIYTSGTTGLPKPAIINIARALSAAVIYNTFGFNANDVMYIVTPLYHSAATHLCLLNTLDKGATMVLRKKFSASHFFEDCRKYDVTVVQYIGELFRYILALPKRPLDAVHKIRAAFGNGLRPDIWREFQDRFKIPRIIEFFGSTEGTASFRNVTNKAGACGRLSPILKFLGRRDIFLVKYDPIEEVPLRDKNGLCIQAEAGEQGVVISLIPETNTGFYKGDSKMNESKILRNVFKEGDRYFCFGDLLYLDKDYYIYFRDRVGDTFRWKGENVSTREVCDVISTLDFVHDVNVYGVHVPGTEGRAGMAAIALKGNVDVTADMLKSLYQKCLTDLPNYARPVFLRIQKDLFVTETLKHRKLELVREGFDVNKVTDPMFYIDNERKTYTHLTPNSVQKVIHSRL